MQHTPLCGPVGYMEACVGGVALGRTSRTYLACELRSSHPETAHDCGGQRAERRAKVVEDLGILDARQEMEVAPLVT
jgi:hypothetical protein